MKVINVVGARPNFMKMAPLVEEMRRRPSLEQVLVHTEQHYDAVMSRLFFEDLGLPVPDIQLGVGSGSHAFQTAKIMMKFEEVLGEVRPDLVVVVGDVNSTLACALVASKMRVPVAHVEAGLRSFDRAMPEEINRIVTDALSDFLFVTERSAQDNLRKEGIPEEKIFFTGNVMIDTLVKNRQKCGESRILRELGLVQQRYALVTLHRPANVDHPETLARLLGALGEVQRRIPVIYPVHPRTRKKIEEFGLCRRFPFLSTGASSQGGNGIRMIDPLGYLDFLRLMSCARLVLTDSGGIQEETTALGVPCVTLRENTERPVTVTEGTNIIAGTTPEGIRTAALGVLEGIRTFPAARVPEKWDGCAARRIVDVLVAREMAGACVCGKNTGPMVIPAAVTRGARL